MLGLWSPIAGDLWRRGEVIFTTSRRLAKAFEEGGGVQALARASSTISGSWPGGTLLHGQKGRHRCRPGGPNANIGVSRRWPNDAWIASPGSMSSSTGRMELPVGGWVRGGRAINNVDGALCRPTSGWWGQGTRPHYDGRPGPNQHWHTNDFTRVWANAANDVCGWLAVTTAWFFTAALDLSMIRTRRLYRFGNAATCSRFANGDAVGDAKNSRRKTAWSASGRATYHNAAHTQRNALWVYADGASCRRLRDSIARVHRSVPGSLVRRYMGTFHIATKWMTIRVDLAARQHVWVSGGGLSLDGTSARLSNRLSSSVSPWPA